jgi:hypothetical protein
MMPSLRMVPAMTVAMVKVRIVRVLVFESLVGVSV